MDFGLLQAFDRAYTHKGLLTLFARLPDLLKQQADRLLGGQQMLAMARTVEIKPAVLFLDGPTEDDQPSMIDLIRNVVIKIRVQNLAVIFFEQRVDVVLNITDQLVFMENRRSLETIDADALRPEAEKI